MEFALYAIFIALLFAIKTVKKQEKLLENEVAHLRKYFKGLEDDDPVIRYENLKEWEREALIKIHSEKSDIKKASLGNVVLFKKASN